MTARDRTVLAVVGIASLTIGATVGSIVRARHVSVQVMLTCTRALITAPDEYRDWLGEIQPNDANLREYLESFDDGFDYWLYGQDNIDPSHSDVDFDDADLEDAAVAE